MFFIPMTYSYLLVKCDRGIPFVISFLPDSGMGFSALWRESFPVTRSTVGPNAGDLFPRGWESAVASADFRPLPCVLFLCMSRPVRLAEPGEFSRKQEMHIRDDHFQFCFPISWTLQLSPSNPSLIPKAYLTALSKVQVLAKPTPTEPGSPLRF